MHVLGKARQATTPKAPRPPKEAKTRTTEQGTSTPTSQQDHAQPLLKDALGLLARNPEDVIGLLLWKGRHRNPALLEQITQNDIDGFKACAEYLEIKPQVLVMRPPGAPEMPPIPATATRSAQPGRPAEGPRPYVVVQLVDEKGNTFMPIENNEEDRRRQEQVENLRRIRDKAKDLGARVLNAGRSENYVLSELEELVEGFLTLAKAQQ